MNYFMCASLTVLLYNSSFLAFFLRVFPFCLRFFKNTCVNKSKEKKIYSANSHRMTSGSVNFNISKPSRLDLPRN